MDEKKHTNYIFIAMIMYTFLCDYIFYGLQGDFYFNGKYIFTKIATVVLCYLVIKKINDTDWNCNYGRLFKKILFVCIFINFVWIILTYPGTWKWDDMFILYNVSENKFYFWQHWLSSFYYMLCLQFIPIPVGVVIIQNIIISIIMANIFTELKLRYKSRLSFLFILLLFIPSIIENNLYPIRSSICAYIELYIIFQLILNNKKFSKLKLYFITFIASILAAWRPENLLWCIAIPMIMILLKTINIKSFSALLLISFISFLGINYYQSYGLNKCIEHTEYGDSNEMDKYVLTGFIQPLGILVNKEIEHKGNIENFDYINSCIDVNMMIEKGGLYSFWNGGFKKINKDDIKILQEIYIRLIKKYPETFINERWNSFLEANNARFVFRSTDIYDSNRPARENFKNKYFFNNSMFDTRTEVVAFLENDYNNENIYAQEINKNINFYNVIPIICILLVISIIEVIRKNYVILTIIAVMMIKLLILIFTIPMSVYMYIFATHLTGLGIIIYWIIANFNKKCLLGENK